MLGQLNATLEEENKALVEQVNKLVEQVNMNSARNNEMFDLSVFYLFPSIIIGRALPR